jgi:hypothetical protein
METDAEAPVRNTFARLDWSRRWEPCRLVACAIFMPKHGGKAGVVLRNGENPGEDDHLPARQAESIRLFVLHNTDAPLELSSSIAGRRREAF